MGNPFYEKDIRCIARLGNGNRKKLSDNTGYKGLGFKAVFGQSNKVAVYTDGESVG
ncbi:hypothetical protein [Chryseobacterium arthrosphaerae]|uniref:hypothetical protein n=1 Tax=Chryseobacterium arthrosphaerae TaxID=651561 RepID=UPI00374371F9